MGKSKWEVGENGYNISASVSHNRILYDINQKLTKNGEIFFLKLRNTNFLILIDRSWKHIIKLKIYCLELLDNTLTLPARRLFWNSDFFWNFFLSNFEIKTGVKACSFWVISSFWYRWKAIFILFPKAFSLCPFKWSGHELWLRDRGSVFCLFLGRLLSSFVLKRLNSNTFYSTHGRGEF